MKREEYLQTIKECILEVLQEGNPMFAVDTDSDGIPNIVTSLSQNDARALGTKKAKRISTEENKEDMKPENIRTSKRDTIRHDYSKIKKN